MSCNSNYIKVITFFGQNNMYHPQAKVRGANQLVTGVYRRMDSGT